MPDNHFISSFVIMVNFAVKIVTYIPMSEQLNIPQLLQTTTAAYPENRAVGYVDGSSISYKEFTLFSEAISARLISLGIEKGDRIAILSQNMPQWGQVYFGITSTGAIAVPLMPDFKPHEVKQILEHSGSKMVFVSKQLSAHVPESAHKIVIEEINDFVNGNTAEYPAFQIGDREINRDDLASIIYTSGTTGDPKGVMLSHGNILFTVLRSSHIQPIEPNDRFLSVLPLSHIYEFSLGLMLPMMFGASITYLRKPPTAPVLLPALEAVKPTVMLTVPLLIEKVFWKSVYPKLTGTPVIRSLYKTALFRKLLHRAAGKKVYKTFGGCLKFYGIGGSKLDARVERFLNDAGFPYAIGYGLTETSPLLAGGSPGRFSFQSTGPAMDDVLLRLHNIDPETGFGEIQAKGENVMKGYYNSPELTAEVFEDGGWFKTGDLGFFDKNSHLHIKGRIKNTIIGSNGKNIFPEEIESVINSLNFVKESLVLDMKGKLVGLVHLDYEAIENHLLQLREDASAIRDKANEILTEIHKQVNSHVNKYSRLQSIMEQPQPFERTPTQKIKRFLYHS